MKRLLVVGTLTSSLVALAALATGCAAELPAPEEEHEQAFDHQGPLTDLGRAHAEEPTSTSDGLRVEAATGCHGCGPVPDPWKSVAGPVPDPWDPDPSSAHTPASSGSSGRPGGGSGKRRP